MTTHLATRIALATGAAALAVSTSALPASAASYVDKSIGICRGKQTVNATCLRVDYWYVKGSKSRGVQFVYASKDTKSSKSMKARWTYQRPGGAVHVGKGWKATKDEGYYQGTGWYAGKHKGPKFPKGTKICIQFKGLSTKACGTLK